MLMTWNKLPVWVTERICFHYKPVEKDHLSVNGLINELTAA